MPRPDLAQVRDLARIVGAFYVRDAALAKAQRALDAALAAGEPTQAQIDGYLAAVERYFTAFAREADAQLRRADRELERLYQLQYNATAERGVAAKRVEAVRDVLARLSGPAAV
jgi:ABC-type transporter Mla subunit MlaD